MEQNNLELLIEEETKAVREARRIRYSNHEFSESCNHIVGYRHGMNDARLVTQEEASDFEPNTLFAHCPKCGEKL